MDQERRMEYENNHNNRQSNLNGEGYYNSKTLGLVNRKNLV